MSIPLYHTFFCPSILGRWHLFERVLATRGTAEKTTGDISYFVNPDFERQIDEWDGKESGGYFYIGKPSEALLSIDMPNDKIYFDKSKIVKNMEEHGIKRETLKQIPYMLEDPIMILQSKTRLNSVVVFGELFQDNKPIMVAMKINISDVGPSEATITKITSVYGKDNVAGLLQESAVLYVNEDKNRTDKWLQTLRLQLPAGVTKYGSIGKITQFKEKVKGFYEFNCTIVNDG